MMEMSWYIIISNKHFINFRNSNCVVNPIVFMFETQGKAKKPSFIHNVDCNAQSSGIINAAFTICSMIHQNFYHLGNTDVGELGYASSTTVEKRKETESARSRKQAKKKGMFICSMNHIAVQILRFFFNVGKFRSSIAKRDPAVKQFKCSDCDCVYSLRSSLARHLKHACGKTPALPCTQCNYRARTKWQIEKHLKRVHKSKIVNMRI